MKKKLSYLIVCLITMITLINSSIVAFAEETYDNVDLMANYGVVISTGSSRFLTFLTTKYAVQILVVDAGYTFESIFFPPNTFPVS